MLWTLLATVSFSSKAVANGNVLFALEHTVCARHTRATFGVECSTLYRPLDREHQARVHLIYESPEGYLRIPGKYDIIVGKVYTELFNWWL